LFGVELVIGIKKKTTTKETAGDMFVLKLQMFTKPVRILKNLGINIIRKPGPMKHGTRVIAFCEDPDGYKVELNEPIKDIK
jgi:catechol 2,3-dioxygenase-like lactoylglutathione lyase family enzyme